MKENKKKNVLDGVGAPATANSNGARGDLFDQIFAHKKNISLERG